MIQVDDNIAHWWDLGISMDLKGPKELDKLANPRKHVTDYNAQNEGGCKHNKSQGVYVM